MINYADGDSDEVFIGREIGHQRSYGEAVATVIDEEIRAIVDTCYADAKKILMDHMDVLHKCANLLLEKERIDREEFESLFKMDGDGDESEVSLVKNI